MPVSALPEKMRDVNFWDGTDNASWLMKLKKRIQYALAAGPRVPSGLFKWREIPKLLFVLKGRGLLRYENTDGTKTLSSAVPIYQCSKICTFHFIECEYYLSRIQPWCRWHVSLQWPLYLNFHVIYSKKNVVKYPIYQSKFAICKLLTFGIGFKRDADKVYWLTANAGGNFE
jgi:hypothetical protein